jgi:hypothetical protein
VESVAWATERRDVLSGFFLLLTVLSYLKAVAPETDKKNCRRWIAVAVMLYLLSLLSKASGMTLPMVLLVLDVYPLRRLGGGVGKWFGAEARRVWFEKLPFFLAAIDAGIFALTAQQRAGALVSAELTIWRTESLKACTALLFTCSRHCCPRVSFLFMISPLISIFLTGV